MWLRLGPFSKSVANLTEPDEKDKYMNQMERKNSRPDIVPPRCGIGPLTHPALNPDDHGESGIN